MTTSNNKQAVLIKGIEVGEGTLTVGTKLGTLGVVTRVGRGPGGAVGAWVADQTGDPGTGYSLPHFCPDWCLKVAVVGQTVCPKPLFECFCGLTHVKTAELERLYLAGAVA